MIVTDWMDDAAATRLLRVLEENCFDYGCAVETLRDLIDRYFAAYMNNEHRAKNCKRASENYDAICAQLRLICNQLLEFDRDLTAAIDGNDHQVTYERQYLNEIAPND